MTEAAGCFALHSNLLVRARRPYKCATALRPLSTAPATRRLALKLRRVLAHFSSSKRGRIALRRVMLATPSESAPPPTAGRWSVSCSRRRPLAGFSASHTTAFHWIPPLICLHRIPPLIRLRSFGSRLPFSSIGSRLSFDLFYAALDEAPAARRLTRPLVAWMREVPTSDPRPRLLAASLYPTSVRPFRSRARQRLQIAASFALKLRRGLDLSILGCTW